MFRGLGLGLLLLATKKMSLISDLTHVQESMDHDNVQMKSMVLVSLMHIKDEVSFVARRLNMRFTFSLSDRVKRID